MSRKERGKNFEERNSEGEFREEGREKEFWEWEEQEPYVMCVRLNEMCFSVVIGKSLCVLQISLWMIRNKWLSYILNCSCKTSIVCVVNFLSPV